jgi:hypothetical protein
MSIWPGWIPGWGLKQLIQLNEKILSEFIGVALH